MPKLKDKRREEFCQQYVVDFNGARAVRDSGYSEKGASVRASKLLANVKVYERVAKLMKDRSERTKITQDMVIAELAVLGFSDFKHYGQIKKSGDLELYPFSGIKEGKTRAIESIKQVTNKDGGSISLKLHGKVKPLELLGKHAGMFVDTHNINLTGDITVISAVPRSKEKEVRE